jgi:hypothetical protein
MTRLFTFLSAFVVLAAYAFAQIPVMPGDSSRRPPAFADSGSRAAIPRHMFKSSAAHKMSGDSMLLVKHSNAEDLLTSNPGIMTFGLGNFLQPSWSGRLGSQPSQTMLMQNGIPLVDWYSGGVMEMMVHPDDAEAAVLVPMHQSFFRYAGSMFAADFPGRDWDSPHPYSRIRHEEGPYGLLATFVLFNQNTSESSNLHFSFTRNTIGYSTSNNTARYANERSEYWNVDVSWQYRPSESWSLWFRDQYYDQTTLEYGGISGWRIENGSFVYPPSSTIFADTAFDPILATTADGSLKLDHVVNTISAKAEHDWTGTRGHVSSFEILYAGSRRRVSDDLDQVSSDAGYSQLDDDIRWKALDVKLNHRSDISLFRLSLSAGLQRLSLEGVRPFFKEDVWNGNMGAMLSTGLAGTTLSIFGRNDVMFGQNTTGFGVTVEDTNIAGMKLWAGGSVYSRPFSYLEKTSAVRDYCATETGNYDNRLDKFLVLEAGMSGSTGPLLFDLHAAWRKVQQYRLLSTVIERDTVPARFGMLMSYGDWGHDILGVDARLQYRFWLINLEASAAYTSVLSGTHTGTFAIAPEFAGSVSVYVREQLIKETLDIKAGASMSYNTTYSPTWYNPRAGLFLISPCEVTGKDFTKAGVLDLFLFATIKRTATIHIILANALDTKYITTSFYPMSDRHIRFGVDWAFLD